MKTYRDLKDAMQRIKDAEDWVKEMERSLDFGGSAETVRLKRESVEDAHRILESLLGEDL